jgi:tetratricopeptide (TPR) repeat protein
VPKLLDFGIAKLLASDATGGVAETVTGLQRMTPDYASPEQVRGEAVSAATDVYALGAVLFELLTGDRVHRLKRYDLEEILREVCLTEVRRPSLIGGPELRGDLDTIILKALQKEPARRYNSVEQFSEDIRRHLEGFPVRARPDTIRYRSSKFLRRHWFTVAALVLIVASLAGGILVARQQAQRAEEEFQQARRLARTALFVVSRGLGNLPGTRHLREVVVKTSLQYLDRLTPRARRDPELRHEIAEGYFQIGQLQHSHDLSNAGDVQGALRSWHRALDLMHDEATATTHSPGPIKLVAGILIAIGEAEMSLGHSQASRDALHQGEPAAQTDISLQPKVVASYGALFSIRNLQGDNELRTGDPQRALQYYKLAWEIGEQSSRESGDRDAAWQRSAGIRMGDVYRVLGQLPEARQWYLRCLDLNRELLQDHTNDYDEQLYRAILQGLLGDLYYAPALALGDRAKALEQFQRAYQDMDRLLRTDPNDANVRDFFIPLGGRYVYALPPARSREALAIAQRLAEAVATIPRGTGLIDFDVQRLTAHLTMARAQIRNGAAAPALASFAEAARIYAETRANAPDQPELAEQGILTLLEWGDAEIKHNPDQARAHYAEALNLASAYHLAHPAHGYLAALQDMARQHVGQARRE